MSSGFFRGEKLFLFPESRFPPCRGDADGSLRASASDLHAYAGHYRRNVAESLDFVAGKGKGNMRSSGPAEGLALRLAKSMIWKKVKFADGEASCQVRHTAHQDGIGIEPGNQGQSEDNLGTARRGSFEIAEDQFVPDSRNTPMDDGIQVLHVEEHGVRVIEDARQILPCGVTACLQRRVQFVGLARLQQLGNEAALQERFSARDCDPTARRAVERSISFDYLYDLRDRDPAANVDPRASRADPRAGAAPLATRTVLQPIRDERTGGANLAARTTIEAAAVRKENFRYRLLRFGVAAPGAAQRAAL